MTETLPAIEVQNLSKTFRMRTADFAGSRRPRLRAKGYRYKEVRVLDDLSFEVRRGELFGIVGRNGSGKSTLLKILARIYGYESGSINVAGQIAPFVHLGVGFHADLTAWDNVRTNAVMMGMTAEEAHERFDRILEFAELEEYRGLELKNYSSGMRMRLAFATLLEVEADILLIDEILGVGDARFREKCTRAFAELREKGKTIIIVSHSLADIRRCDRAMLIQEGKVGALGDPDEVIRRYLDAQGVEARAKKPEAAPPAGVVDGAPPVQIVDKWLEDAAGRIAARVPMGEPTRLHAVLELGRAIKNAAFACEIHDEDGEIAAEVESEPLGGPEARLRPGDRVHVQVPLAAELMPGSYIATCRVMRTAKRGRELPLTEAALLGFAVSRAGRTLPAPRTPSQGEPPRDSEDGPKPVSSAAVEAGATVRP